MKVLKHCIYIQYGCGMQSAVVYSLNHDTMMSFWLCLTQIYQTFAPTCTGWRCSNTVYTSNMDLGCNQRWFTASTMTPWCLFGSALPKFIKLLPPPVQVKQCKGAPICPSTAYEGAQTLYIHPIWMWDKVSGGLQPQPWHHNVIWAPPYPNTPKFCPHLLRYNSVRVHPYAHPQHKKLLEHLYTSNTDVGCSPQWFTASTMTLQCHLGSTLPQFSKIWPPPAQV